MNWSNHLSTAEAAKRLGVSQGRVQQLVASGQLPSVKRGRDRWIPVSAVEARLRAGARPGPKPKPEGEISASGRSQRRRRAKAGESGKVVGRERARKSE